MNDEILLHGTDFNHIDNMGGLSQVECYLNQHREENDNDVVNATKPPNTYHKKALPLFEEMVNSCPNKHKPY